MPAGAQHSRRRKNPDLAGRKQWRHRQLGEAAAAPCCCNSPHGLEIQLAAESAAGARAAAQTLVAALPGIVPAAQSGACPASVNVSGMPLGLW